MSPAPSSFGCSPNDIDERYLNSKQVRARYGEVSDMWLWRRQNDESGFPKPTEIYGRRFWKVSELVAWERKIAPTAPTVAA